MVLIPPFWALVVCGSSIVGTGAFFAPCSHRQHRHLHLTQKLASFRPSPIVRYAEDAASDNQYGDTESLFSQSPQEVFAQLTTASSTDTAVVTYEDIGEWDELRELLEDGEILESELQTFYNQAKSGEDGLDSSGFARFYSAIDDLFEDDVVQDDTASQVDDSDAASAAPAASRADNDISTSTEEDTETNVLADLLLLLSELNNDPQSLPCGLECKDSVRGRVADLITALRDDNSNIVKTNGGIVEVKSLIGTWSLLYTSSLTMIINKSLSGLGRSTSEGAKFGGLKQTFTGTKYFGECKFVERIDAGDDASFDVVVDGEWQLKDGADPYTGERITVWKADLARLKYPGNSAKADDWASLGPIKMLDIICVVDDVLVLRGVTLTGEESVFVWQKDA